MGVSHLDCVSRVEAREISSSNDFSTKEKSSINKLMKNLNRQRTVMIAETNEVVVKKKTQFC